MSRDLRAQLVKTIRKQVNLINLAAQYVLSNMIGAGFHNSRRRNFQYI